ncbi:MAG: tetratricopeptide repeat protein [Bacteroidota bacterium]
MDRTKTASVYLAFANHNKKKKGVQHLKSLYDSLAPILQVSEINPNIELIREDRDGIPYAYELLQESLPYPGLQLVHLEADTNKSEEWLLNASGGKRLPIDWDILFLDHLEDLKLIYLDKGASLDAVEKLLFAGAPAVIGTQFDFQDREAELFRSRFYAELSSGSTLQKAYEHAAAAVSQTCMMKKIPSDPYEYWASKENEVDNTFHWGLYYLSANESILQWQMIDFSRVENTAPIIPPPPPVEKPVNGIEKIERISSFEEKPLQVENKPVLKHEIEEEGELPDPEPVFVAKETNIEVRAFEKEPTPSLQTPALGLKVSSEEVESMSIFPSLVEVRIKETFHIRLQENPKTEELQLVEEVQEAEPIVEEPILPPLPKKEVDETEVEIAPVENKLPREEEIEEEPAPKIEAKIEVPEPQLPSREIPQRENPQRQSTNPNIIPLNRNKEERSESQGIFTYDPAPTPTEKKSRPERGNTSLKRVDKKADYLMANPPKKKISIAPILNSKPMIFAGIGLTVIGLIMAGVFIFTATDLDESWATDQGSYLSAFGGGDSYNILLLPFKEYEDCIAEDAFDEIAIRDRLNLLEEGEDMGIKVKFMGDGACPKNSEEARRIGNIYNADLVVWGNYPEIHKDSVNLHTRYISLRNNSNFMGNQNKNLGKLALGDNYDLQEGYIAGNIDDVVSWLLGIISLRNEEYINALQFFEQMNLEDSHESANLYHLMAKCYQGLEQYDQVLQAYNQVIFLSPNNANAYHNRGLLYQHLKQEDQAVADFSEAIRINPRHIKAHYNRNLLMEGEIDDSFYVDPELMETTEEVWETNDEDELDTFPSEEARLVTETDRSGGEVTEAVLIQDGISEVEDLYEGRSGQNLSRAETYFMDGLNLERRGRLSDAVESYNQAIESSPKNSGYYHARAKTYEKIGKTKDALNDYTTAIQYDTRNTEIYMNRAYLFERMKKHYEAIADYSKITKLSPKSPGAYLYRGKAYQFVKQPRKALADFEKAIDLNPQDATGYYFRAKLHEELKKPNLAIQDFSHAIEINPGYSSAYRERGELYASRKEFKAAIQDFNKVLTLNPRDANIFARRAEMHESVGNEVQAMKDLQQAVRLAPNNKKFKNMLERLID